MSDAAPTLDFKGKLGKFPVWLWGVLIAGAALVAYFLFIRGRGGASNTGSTLDPSGYQTAGIQGGSASAATPRADNNTTWLTRVSRQVSDTLSASPSDVYGAIKKWLQGEGITRQEKAWVDKAIELGMNPPEGTQGTSNIVTSFLGNFWSLAGGGTKAMQDDGTFTVYQNRQAVWADSRPVTITDAAGVKVTEFIKRGTDYFVRNANGAETKLTAAQLDGINAQFGPSGRTWSNG